LPRAGGTQGGSDAGAERRAAPAGLGVDDDDEDEAPPPPGASRPPDDRYVIELETVRIDKANGSMKGQANDIEAYELFLARLKEHRCLKKVETQTTEIVTFQRHTGWRDFQLKFNVDCSERAGAKSAKSAKAAKGTKVAKAADGAAGAAAESAEGAPAATGAGEEDE
jgi:hypothetical protein